MSKKHTEVRLEDAIEYQFTEQDCHQKGISDDYEPERALEPCTCELWYNQYSMFPR